MESVDQHLLRDAVASGRIQWHRHGLERAFGRGISRAEVLEAILHGEVIEEYSERRPHASCLILRIAEKPLHVVAAGDADAGICHIVTVYRPDLDHFEPDFRTRKKRP